MQATMLTDATRILAKHDLEDLMRFGCPEDEYEPEAKRLLERCNATTPVAELTTVLKDIFHEMFGAPGETCRRDTAKFTAAAIELQHAWIEAEKRQ